MKTPWHRWNRTRPPTSDPKPPRDNHDPTDAEAQFALGVEYSQPDGARRNPTLAIYWYRKAATQNHARAQFNLGMMCANGQGLARDKEEAAIWFERAATLGDAQAQYHLGVTRHRASLAGTDPDAAEARIEAFKWLQLAAAQGYKDAAAACERVTLTMTGTEVSEANHRVARFSAGKVTSRSEP